jgi:hypothetical protein
MDYLNGYTYLIYVCGDLQLTFRQISSIIIWYLKHYNSIAIFETLNRIWNFLQCVKNTSLTYLLVVAWRDWIDVTTFIRLGEVCMLESLSTTFFKTFFLQMTNFMLQLNFHTTTWEAYILYILLVFFSNFDYLFQMSICNWTNLFNSMLHSRWLFGGHHKRKWNMYSHSNIPLMILNYSMSIKCFGFHFIC